VNDDFIAQQAIQEFKKKQAEELSRRMATLGKKSTKRKRKAAQSNVKKAHAKLRKTWWNPEWRKKHQK
jgi:hypothetical protein